MATSPNFSWPEPDNTDLVKNGALAIRTLGDAIDSSMADLKGGTTGQVLKKNSNTDMDFVWSADSAGMTNPMTTTGDTIYSSSGSTPARLGIGSTGQVLTVSGGVPTWATPSSGTPAYVGVSLAASANQTISNSTSTAIVWDTENFDTDAFHSNVTNNTRVTIPSGKAGKYQVNLLGNWYNNSTGVRVLAVYVNGTVFKGVKMQAQTEEQSQVIALTLNLSVGDYVEGYVFQNSGASRIFYSSGDQGHMSLNYLGA